MRALDLVADCDRCAALCCVYISFDASPAFAYSKPAGEECVHLRANRCRIHTQKAARGFAGCAAYDCHGAGQRATELFAREDVARLTRGLPPLRDHEKHDAFAALREVHELAWVLRGAVDLGRTMAGESHEVFLDEGDMAAMLVRLEVAASADISALREIDLDELRRGVRQLLPARAVLLRR